jgi:hypothetical protein
MIRLVPSECDVVSSFHYLLEFALYHTWLTYVQCRYVPTYSVKSLILLEASSLHRSDMSIRRQYTTGTWGDLLNRSMRT